MPEDEKKVCDLDKLVVYTLGLWENFLLKSSTYGIDEIFSFFIVKIQILYFIFTAFSQTINKLKISSILLVEFLRTKCLDVPNIYTTTVVFNFMIIFVISLFMFELFFANVTVYLIRI